MARKFVSLLIFSILFPLFTFAGGYRDRVAFEAGVGTGFARYGSSETRDLISSSDAESGFVADFSAFFFVPIEKRAFLALGADSVLDANWGGGESVVLWDYSFHVGFRIYPNLAGLCLNVSYALGRRTDFIDAEIGGENLETTESTCWGNGFLFGAFYDFTYHTSFLAPEVGVSWKRMPRGGSSDNYINVSLKLKF